MTDIQVQIHAAAPTDFLHVHKDLRKKSILAKSAVRYSML